MIYLYFPKCLAAVWRASHGVPTSDETNLRIGKNFDSFTTSMQV